MQNFQNLPEEWINNYTDELLSRAVYKLSDVENAKDIVQDTFLAAAKNIHSFKQKSNPKTWLFSILNNKISDFYRKKYREDKKINTDISSFFTETGDWKPDKQPQNWEQSGKNLLDNMAFIEILDYCLEHLPNKYNSVIKMKYYSEKTPEEICQELEISSTNMWQIMHRAKLKLRDCIENGWFKNN